MMVRAAMISTQEAKDRVRAAFNRHAPTWAAALALDGPVASLTGLPRVALHPPSERDALSHQDAAIAWVNAWRDLTEPGVKWEDRQWANLGTQSVPVRLVVPNPAEAARMAGRLPLWRTMAGRLTELAGRLRPARDEGMVAPGLAPDLLATSLRKHARSISALPPEDFTRLCDAVVWLVDHPDSGMYVRQLPIRGLDTKWIGQHLAMVRDLVLAVTGLPDIGLATSPPLLRVRFLDAAMAPEGLADVTALPAELAALRIKPTRVLVFENLQCVLAMPPVPGAVVIHGGGYGVDLLAGIGWIRPAQITYWGDLDTHGFAILGRFRSHFPAAVSAMMDATTLETHLDLAVDEPNPATGSIPNLTPPEQAALAKLRECGRRLEQERLPWKDCLAVLLGPGG